MDSSRLRSLAQATDCDIRFDALTRQLYATDASIYQLEPVGVAFPRTALEASAVIRAAADCHVPVTPRGAGTGLAGGAVGDGLVIDFARYNRQITKLNVEDRTVRVGAGVVLDQLNGYLKPHGLQFGPDVATSSRATLGGMIAINSSGAHAPVYGLTDDHLRAVEVILADGTIAGVSRDNGALADIRIGVEKVVGKYAQLIEDRLPPGLIKRWPGYGLDRYLRHDKDFLRIICGSEGTLAGVMSAELSLVPLPQRNGIVVLFFASVPDAMQASVECLAFKPAAIEHIDKLLFDQTKGQLEFKSARALMKLDEQPCEAILIVEFFDDDIDDKLQELAKRNLGQRQLILTDRDVAEQDLVWKVRKSGLSLLTACKGEAKPTPGTEDVCVLPEQLPEYVKGLQSIVKPLGIEASFYGHAGSGCLHVRPKVNLHTAGDIAKYRQIAGEVSALCKQFKASFASEHGVGIVRTEYMEEHIGPELLQAARELKQVFDPNNVLNPGKVVDDGTFKIDTKLRYGDGYKIRPPFEPVWGYIERDDSFVDNLEQCNGCGGCRKDPPTMCPTFQATDEEIMVTRGRANTIRAALDGRFGGGDPLTLPELDEALSNCLSCKTCKTECPSNVDLTLLKSDLIHARQQRDGVPLLDKLISNSDWLGRMGTMFYPISNWALKFPLTGWFSEKLLGFTAKRSFPAYASQRFDKWFAKRTGGKKGSRGKVILWDDTWVRYHEPDIGQAAVKVLESAGYEVVLADDRKCCGRPACSRGVLNKVKRAGEHNISMFKGMGPDEPIVFLEPSCFTMFIDEYRQLKIPGADEVADRCILFEQFIYNLLLKEPNALPFKQNGTLQASIHGHCYAKALTDTSIMPKLVGLLPDGSASMLNTGCCGMAGAFGMLKKKYELSRQVAQPLVDQIEAMSDATHLIASGTSCRHQITHLTDKEPLHMAELLAMVL
ncbi:MAG: FAD-binding and (Fe-S)-binding domain-containing protein [Planctomycetota bacterium]